MEKPIDPVTVVAGIPTWTVAVIVAAPAAAVLEEFRVTVATPVTSVKAVVGVIVAEAVSVLKVTTALATAAPAASLNVAFTVAGADVTVAPVASVSASVIVGTFVAIPVVSDETGVPPDPPEPQPARANTKKSDAGNLGIPWLKNF